MVLNKRYRWTNHQNRRYYESWGCVNLFGELEVIRLWGGIGTNRGRMTVTPHKSSHGALNDLAKIDRTRQLHGYALVE